MAKFTPTYDPNAPVDLQKLRSVAVSAAAAPTRTGANRVNDIEATEQRWSKDFDAYRRLRREGLQPERSDGAATIEARATERHEVEGGIPPKLAERVAEATAA